MIPFIQDALTAHPFWGVVVCVLLLMASAGNETPETKKLRIATGKRQDPIDNFFSYVAFFFLIFLIIVWIGA